MIRPLMIIVAAILILAAPSGQAQTFSYDGNRWYEIEVSIFSNENARQTSERTNPANTTLEYPESVIALTSASAGFLIPFPDTDPVASIRDSMLPEPGQSANFGPRLPGPEGRFRLPDFRRDPFVALGDKQAAFTAYNQAISRSSEHRLLFHAVWRQPVLNRVQATAIQVTGGESLGGHYELEGSLKFSYNINRVDVDARLWRTDVDAVASQFSRQSTSAWTLPPLPVSEEGFSGSLSVPVLYYMNQTRSMISNELHFLDHPALGVLVEIRPYQLPELSSFSFD